MVTVLRWCLTSLVIGLVGACSGSSNVESEDRAQSAPLEAGGDAVPNGEGTDENRSGFASPLADLLGVPLSSEESNEAHRVVLGDRESVIEKCMRALGFDYISDIRNQQPGADPEPVLFYGIARTVAYSRGENSFAWENPNLALIEELDPAAKADWATAFGRSDEGCNGQSRSEHPDADSVPIGLFDELNALSDAVEAHSSVVAGSPTREKVRYDLELEHVEINGSRIELLTAESQ